MRLIMPNISKRYFLLLTFTVFWILSGCEQSTLPELKPPIANAGPDQTTQVGSYAIIDGSGSSPGDGEKIVWYEWIADKNNPQEVAVFSGDADSMQAIGFTKEGIYKFTLVVNNGIQDSEPDEVVVTVNPRDNIIFEDPSLEVHVRYFLKKPTEELTETVLASLDSVHCFDIIVKEVTSLDGIEKCINLEYLNMGHQRIVDLSPLAHLVKLTYLNLTQNRHIKDISPLAGLTRLRYLNLDSNEITDISPLANLTQLTYLNVMWNPINGILAVANMKDLEELWISHSPIVDISPVAELKKLSFLWLSKCQITDITPITNLASLRLLFLQHNYITDISPLSGLIHLERLYLEDNQIVDIPPLENLTGLDLLLLSKNQVSDILPLVNNSGLEEGDFVNLSSNPLNEISVNEYIPALR
ncbi:MAG: leucine-rich repeat domain-containing protein, partial [candidate division WOR-3 bacterium]|nr:leucine-rich repeat domain-containing protein [candidate division WOR-3 bacterium]